MREETSERYRKTRQMYELGMSNDEIADAIGVKPNSVNKILHLAGVRKQKEMDTRERDEYIRQLYQEGMSQNEIAKITGHSTCLIWDVINGKGRYRTSTKGYVGRFEEEIDTSKCVYAEKMKPLEHCIYNGKSYIDITPVFGY